MRDPAETSCELLMRRFRDRLDGEAFEEIVSRFLAPGLAVAGRLLSDSALAEDAVQEAFLRVVRCRRQYVPARPFSSWFYAILRNVCTDLLRRRARQAKLVRDAAAEARPPSREPPSSSGDGEDLLKLLPPEARAVLTLRVVHELPFRDVAAALGISEEAAKKRAQRALRQLRGLWSARRRPAPCPAGAPVVEGRGRGGPAREVVPDSIR